MARWRSVNKGPATTSDLFQMNFTSWACISLLNNTNNSFCRRWYLFVTRIHADKKSQAISTMLTVWSWKISSHTLRGKRGCFLAQQISVFSTGTRIHQRQTLLPTTRSSLKMRPVCCSKTSAIEKFWMWIPRQQLLVIIQRENWSRHQNISKL